MLHIVGALTDIDCAFDQMADATPAAPAETTPTPAAPAAADAAAPAAVDPAAAAVGADAAALADAVPAPPAAPSLASFQVKETGDVAQVIFCSTRLTGQQMSDILFAPTVWDLGAAKNPLYAESDYIHPKFMVTPYLIGQPEFKKAKKDAVSVAKLANKTAAQPVDPDAQALSKVNELLFDKMVTLFAALLERAAAEGQWIVVDRVRARAPAAELLLECALLKASAKPTILVIDSLQRLQKFGEDPVGSSHLADLARLRATAKECAAAKGKGGAKGKGKGASSAGSLELPAFYSLDAFGDARAFAKPDVKCPCEPDPSHYNKRTQRVDPRVAWSYHYYRTMFASGTHYLLFEDDDIATDIRGMLKFGTVAFNGDSGNTTHRASNPLDSPRCASQPHSTHIASSLPVAR